MVGTKKNLSKAGKEIPLKSMLQATPSYVMSVFILHATLCEELERMMNSIGRVEIRKKKMGICWMAWNLLDAHKWYGSGLTFKKYLH